MWGQQLDTKEKIALFAHNHVFSAHDARAVTLGETMRKQTNNADDSEKKRHKREEKKVFGEEKVRRERERKINSRNKRNKVRKREKKRTPKEGERD